GDRRVPRIEPARRSAQSLSGDRGVPWPCASRLAGGTDDVGRTRVQRGAASAAPPIPQRPTISSDRGAGGAQRRWSTVGAAARARRRRHRSDHPVNDKLPRATRDFYLRAMRLLDEASIEFLVGGAYAFERYTGIARHTKDFDIFVHPRDVE